MATEPIRLQYRLVYVSSQDDNFGESLDAVNLSVRRGSGWVSSKYCHFPQEVVLRLHQNSTIERIQILCHHVFIPAQVDIYVGHAPGDTPSWMNATYDKLGTVTFQDNAESGYKTRELKTVRVDNAGIFVKLYLFENHKNEHNPFSQVALMNITVFGYPVGPKHADASDSEIDLEPTIPHQVTPSFVSRGRRAPVHQSRSYAGLELVERNTPDEQTVMNGMSHGQEMRTIEHILDVKKKAAVRDEQFDDAKRLKSAMDKLHEAGERIDKLNSEKRAAIEDENYDKADHYKQEMDAVRLRAYQEIELWEILTEKEQKDLGLDILDPRQAKPPSRLARSESAPANKRPNSNPKSNPYLDRDNMILPAIRHQQLRQQSRMRQHSDDYDPRLPRIDQGSTPPGNRFEEYPPEDANGDTEVMDENENDEQAIYRLHPKDLSQLTLAINTFGGKMVKNCTSKHWQDRQKGLQDLYTYLDQHRFNDRDDAYNVLMPTLQLLQRGLKDKIFNVYKEATVVLRYLLITFLPKYKIAKTGGTLVAERTYFILITRAGDSISDPRFRPMSIEFAENAVAKTDIQIAKAYASCFLRPFQASGHQKIDQAHAEIAERIITFKEAPNLDLDLTEEKICPFAVSCLQHTDASVRQTGIRILSYIYKMGNREKTYASEPSDFERLKRENEDLKRQLTSHSGMGPVTPPSALTAATYAAAPNGTECPQTADPMCVFCGEMNRAFDEETLDMHYLKYCPMLTKCQLCKKVVEVSALKEHYLDECSAKDTLQQCPRCKEPLLDEEYKRHQIQKRCQPPKAGVSVERCLLCHSDVSPSTDIDWRHHLIGATGCPANPRKTYGVGGAKGPASRRRNSTGAIELKKNF